MSRRAALLVCAAVPLLGCGGSRYVKLDAKKVRSLSVRLAGGGETICPTAGELPQVVGVAVYDDKRVFETWAPLNQAGKLRPRELEWTAEVGTVDEDGVLELPLDILPWHDRTFVVRAKVPKRPEMNAELRLTPRYDCGGTASFEGLDGYDGGTGRDGEPGGAGPRIEVALAYVETTLNGRLVLVRVRDRDLGRLGYYLIDPHAARLVISANGGDGGNGGNGASGRGGVAGARGVDGASGGVCQDGQEGSPGADGEDGTDGQPGGRGGDGGNGGLISLVYPAAFPELAQVIAFTVDGGKGGAGGPGGQGGSGGEGGRGGNGGSAGPTSDPQQACETHAGSDGREGAKGRDGLTGSSGPAGRPGDPGTVSARPAGMQEMFSFELARGWRIVVNRQP